MWENRERELGRVDKTRLDSLGLGAIIPTTVPQFVGKVLRGYF